MRSVQFSEWEKERRGEGVCRGRDGRCLWSIFCWRGGGGCLNESGGDKKRHLSLQLSQRGCLKKKKNTGSTRGMNKLDVLTSMMTNMNITYKMPHVSTKLYSYIYVYTVRNLKIKRGRRGRGRWSVGFVSFGILYRQRGTKQKKAATFKEDETISLATT